MLAIDPALAAALEDAARLDLSQALSTLIPARALGVAIAGADGRVRFIDLAGAGLPFYHAHPDEVADQFADHARQSTTR